MVYLSSIRKIPYFSSDLKIGKQGLKALGDRRELGGTFYAPGRFVGDMGALKARRGGSCGLGLGALKPSTVVGEP